MRTMRIASGFFRIAPLFVLAGAVLAPWTLGGCNTTFSTSGGGGTTDPNGGDDGEDGETTAEITNLNGADLPASGNQPITINYTVPASATNLAAFYVPTALAEDAGQRQPFEFGTPLAAGTSSFTINVADLPGGTYRIGISYVDGGSSFTILSEASLIVEGLPSPQFFSPDQDTSVVAGATVPIVADLGDPEAEVAWRLFYVKSSGATPIEDLTSIEQIAQLGTELRASTGNAISFEWNTSGVAAETYVIGVSATDTGTPIDDVDQADLDKVVTAYCDHTVTVLSEEPPPPAQPTLLVSQPGEDTAVFLAGSVDIAFQADLVEQTFVGMTLFYDTDAVYSNGFAGVIAEDLAETDTSATWELDSDDSEGLYYVGVLLEYGEGDSVATYATGRVDFVKTPSLTVTAPASDTITQPNNSVSIAWTTNVPASVAETEVVAQRISDGHTVVVQEAGSSGDTSVSWTPTAVQGRFTILVRIIFTDEEVDDLTAQAPGAVRVSTAPPIIWVGSFADDDESSQPAGAIFGGVQFEDNLGTDFSSVGDLDGDGADEFMMAARYGKPFFTNPEGIGEGEAYLIYGSRDRYGGIYNVNSVGTETLRGVTFTGIRTPQGNWDTDGLSDLSRIPDVDGDDLDELVFGFPTVNSRGHNVDPDQDGVRPPEELESLEKAGQFLRGGLVIVSSTNSILQNPDAGTPVINLDLVGQRFDTNCVLFEPGTEGDLILDLFSYDSDTGECTGSCDEPATDGNPDGTLMNWGFVAALADDYFAAMWGSGCLNDYDLHLNRCRFDDALGITRLQTDYCTDLGPGICQPSSPALHNAVGRHPDTAFRGFGYSGYYPDTWDNNDDGNPDTVSEEDLVENKPHEPYGARIIGVGLEDGFGSSITLSNPLDSGAGDIIISAPNRTARGILFQQGQDWEPDWPETGGEITGLERPAGTPATNADSGVAYLFSLRNLWTEDGSDRIPPKPHQYIVGEPSHCGAPRGADGNTVNRIPNIEATRIAGAANEKIRNIRGIKDFNGDGRNDIAVGAPEAMSGSGRLYIAFRREKAVEGDYVLEKLELGADDAERLSGVLITGSSGSQFAFSMATDVDLNGDDEPDLVVAAPGAGSNSGEVAIIFSSPSLITPAGGTSIDDLIAQGRAAKIVGWTDEQGYFGYNVTNAGDIDGDGKNDLLIAAPGATPRFDSTPDDDDDTLDSFGLDLDGDGLLDNVTGPNGVPEEEGEPNDDALDELRQAGLVYIIWGSNCLSRLDCPDSENETNVFNISELGASGLEGAIVVGRRGADASAGRDGDFFGGGDAGDTAFGGITSKQDRGRSYGLRAAGDVDGDGQADFLVGSVTATPRIDPITGEGTTRGGEAYLIYGFDR